MQVNDIYSPQVDHVISGCRVVLDRVTDSPTLKIYLILLFIVLPILKVVFSVIKTERKSKLLQLGCDNRLPTKLDLLVEKHKIDNSKIVVSNGTNFVAITTGFINKKIIISKSLINKLSSKELEAVLLHEVHHLNHNHSLALFLGELIASTLFFIPSVRDIIKNIKTEFERNADCAAVDYQKTTKFVKRSLLKILSRECEFEVYPHFAPHILDQRLDNLDYKKKKYIFSKRKAVVSFLVISLFSVLFHLNSKYAMASVVEDHITCSLYECAYDCVATEFSFKKEPMSLNNFSVEGK